MVDWSDDHGVVQTEDWWIAETILQVVPFNSRAGVTSFVSGIHSDSSISFPSLVDDEGWSTVKPCFFLVFFFAS